MDTLLGEADVASVEAELTRERWRWKSHPDKAAAIEEADFRLHEVAQGLLQENSRARQVAWRYERWGPQLEAASRRVRRERRKLWKMKNPRGAK